MDNDIVTRPLLEETEIEDNDINGSFENGDTLVVNPINAALEELNIRCPPDRYSLWYATFYLLGIVTLLPWNFFITANDYWMYKFREINSTQLEHKSALQAEFTSYVSLASTVPSVFFLILNSLISHRISVQVRMIGSFVVILLVFVITTVFVEVDTDSWQELFFAITLANVVLVNIGSALLQAGLWAIVCKFSASYITATVSGQALGGIFAAVASIVSLALGASPTRCALFYFLIADVTLVLSLVAYSLLYRSIFFKYHMLVKTPANSLQYDPAEVEDCNSVPAVHVSLSTVFYKIRNHGFAVFMCFAVTLSVYPAVTVLITSSSATNNEWTDVYFVPVIAFLLFSCCDYIGRVAAGLFNWPKKSSLCLLVFSIVRVAFIPVLLSCNTHPRHNLPVYIPQDYYYILITTLFALTNGYLTNMCLMTVPNVVSSEEQEVASSMMAAFLGIGCAVGSLISVVLVKML